MVAQACLKSFIWSFKLSSQSRKKNKNSKKNSAYSSTRRLLFPLAQMSIINFKRKTLAKKSNCNSGEKKTIHLYLTFPMKSLRGKLFTALPTLWNHFMHKYDKTSLRCFKDYTKCDSIACCLQKQKVDVI